jgi:para-nitrobenzyl esterase
MTIVDTKYGRLEGIRREGDVAFLGIPFGAPPVGERRFRAPEPPASWAGVRKATAWGFACPQGSHPIPGFAASGPQDEDCLYLNVYTPAADSQRRPVMFWIHGGAFTHGTGAEPLFDGGPLARRGDVVVVTINYRLGALGYLYLGDHLPGAGLTANAGQLDQIAALQWVHDNIEAFGGDPGNVTIFGESAGAGAIGALLGMPAATGLFHRAILESGTGRATPIETSVKVTDLVLETLGIDRRRAADLRTVPVASIIEAQGAVAGRAGGPAFGPVLDGTTIPERPIDAVRRGASASVPVLVGTNRDEVKLFAASTRREPIDDDQLAKSVSIALGNLDDGKSRALIEVYRRSRRERGLPDSNLDMLDAIGSDA